MKKNVVLDKSFDFAVSIVKLVRQLQQSHKEFVLTKQLVRLASSIGANAEEAIGASSARDFVYKFELAYREARESRYWISLLTAAGYIAEDLAQTHLNDCDELLRIIASIIVTTKAKSTNTDTPHS